MLRSGGGHGCIDIPAHGSAGVDLPKEGCETKARRTDQPIRGSWSWRAYGGEGEADWGCAVRRFRHGLAMWRLNRGRQTAERVQSPNPALPLKAGKDYLSRVHLYVPHLGDMGSWEDNTQGRPARRLRDAQNPSDPVTHNSPKPVRQATPGFALPGGRQGLRNRTMGKANEAGVHCAPTASADAEPGCMRGRIGQTGRRSMQKPLNPLGIKGLCTGCREERGELRCLPEALGQLLRTAVPN